MDVMGSNMDALQATLESIKQISDDMEYWSARELMVLLDYNRWEIFLTPLNRAITPVSRSYTIEVSFS